jgi:hypothetical protein
MSTHIDISGPNAKDFRAQVRSLIGSPPSWMTPVCFIINTYLDNLPEDLTNTVYSKETTYDSITVKFHCTHGDYRFIVQKSNINLYHIVMHNAMLNDANYFQHIEKFEKNRSSQIQPQAFYRNDGSIGYYC